MKAKTGLTFLLAVGALVGVAAPAGADSMAVFYSGGAGYGGSFSGATSVYLATSGTSIATCAAACNNVGGDTIQASITFATTVANPVQITADSNAPTAPFVWFDKAPAYGGLGLQTATGIAGTGDD